MYSKRAKRTFPGLIIDAEVMTLIFVTKIGKQQNQPELNERKPTAGTTSKQKQQEQQQRSKKVQEYDAKQRNQGRIMEMFKKIEAKQQESTPMGKTSAAQQQQTTTEDQQRNPTKETTNKKTELEQEEQQNVKTKNNKQPTTTTTQEAVKMRTKPMKRKQQQQQDDEEMQKQQKIIKYVRKQEQQREEQQNETRRTEQEEQPGGTTTTTELRKKQQQQPNCEETKQQQQPPRMTVRSKGIVISDLKLFLEQKKVERAARVNEVKNKVQSAEYRTKLNLQNVQSALRPRPGEIRRPDDHAIGNTGAAEGD